jgi:hypothetical protein
MLPPGKSNEDSVSKPATVASDLKVVKSVRHRMQQVVKGVRHLLDTLYNYDSNTVPLVII